MRYIVLVLLFLTGCAGGYAPNYDYKWYKKFNEPYKMRLVEVGKEKVAAHCGGDTRVLACAVRIDELKACAVLTSVSFLPKWALEHEKMHCDGWSHDKIPV